MFVTLAINASATTTYRTIAIIGFIFAALCLVLSIAIFFLYDIKSVYGYLTGRKQKKGVLEMRREQGNAKKKKLTTPSVQFNTAVPEPEPVKHEAGILQPFQESVSEAAAPQEVYEDSVAQEGTQPLSAQAEEFNSAPQTEQTDVLNAAPILQEVREEELAGKEIQIGTFILVKNEMLIHTDEIL